jgi:hypothetical protein
MAASTSGPVIADNEQAARFEIRVDGELAGFAEYRRRPGLIAFTHTQVEPRFAGKGLGGRLLAAALQAARAADLAVLPFCPFLRDYIAAHPDELDLVPPGRRAAFDLPPAPDAGRA